MEGDKEKCSAEQLNTQLSSTHLGMSIEDRFKILRSIGEECISDEDLLGLLQKKPNFTAYDGFEPSGRMHIAQGILKSINVNKITQCGGNFLFWVADWLALMNNKLDGNQERIRTVGRYFIEVWKAAGMDMSEDKVKFIWSSEAILANPDKYWSLVLDISRKNSLSRILRCTQIMGRSESDDLSAAQVLYPAMQCADIFFLGIDVCQLGMDQRKVNVLAREYCDTIKRKNKPVILSHHMLMGLKEGQEKMSKSDPDSAIFMEDDEAEVNRKIKSAFCPPQIVENNPVLDYVKHLVFGKWNSFQVERSEKNGGPILFSTYEQLEEDFKSGNLHPGDLKPAVAKAINEMIKPVRDHFKNDPEAKKLLDAVKSFRVSR